MTRENVLTLLRERKRQQELVLVSWLDRAEWQSAWADAAILDDGTVAVTEVKNHRYVPTSDVAAELITPTADLQQVLTMSGVIHASDSQHSLFRPDSFRLDEVLTYQHPGGYGPSLPLPETYLLDTPEAFTRIRNWLDCVQICFPDDQSYDSDAGEFRLKFWELAEDIPGGASGYAAFPLDLRIPFVEDIKIRRDPEYTGYIFGPHLLYDCQHRRISFGQYGIWGWLRGPDFSVDLTVSSLAGTVRRTGVPSWAWEAKHEGTR